MISIRTLAALASIIFFLTAGCGSVVTKGDAGEDGGPDADDPASEGLDAPGDPDPDAGDPSISDPDPDADDAAEDTVTGDPTSDGSGCGNGTVDTGEECDDDSDFCVDCALTAPSGWVECTDSAGNPAFLFIEDWAGTHTQGEFADHCETMIEDMSPEDFAHYGLAVLSDGDIWDCIRPELGAGPYYVGLFQDTSASDYGEPDGGWYWMADDGSGRTDVDPFDGSSGPVPGSFDNGGGGGNVECGRLQSGGGGWSFSDYSCDASMDWDGICMIQY
ncbi:MAG: hypothetical protein JRG91_11955 [Deltaproteobacteria bacterium]|nr:hypothetical protein [Deltaproteobacteria bacterium]